MIMSPQGQGLPNALLSVSRGKQQSQHRNISLQVPFKLSSPKSFKNPNFVNNSFNRCQTNYGAVIDNCQKHLIDSIKEKCPEVIPGSETGNQEENSTAVEEIAYKMGLDETIMTEADKITQSSPILIPKHPNFITESIMNLSPKRSRYSFTDSSDSFVVFDHDGNEGSTDVEDSDDEESIDILRRRPSICESEDSFITFEKPDIEGDDGGDISFDEEDDDASSEKTEENYAGVDQVDFSFVDVKKVRFAAEDKLCEVHPMIKWSYAYQAARKGPWETFARDRCRFKDRVARVERDVKHVLNPEHRAKIYRERFEQL
ncbi:hypothetical protein ABEB36_015176 [Hypothenemus hampei]